jgi:hypothetical protein
MSRREDVLFCQIAIANGLLNEDTAKKALSICDRHEVEAGRRPPIGSMLTKKNLLAASDAQRIYQAVQKRLGNAGIAPAPSRGTRGAARNSLRAGRGRSGAVASRGAGARGERGASGARQPATAIDPTTLWMGIGGMVAFLVIIGVILFLVLRKPGEKPEIRDKRLLWQSGSSSSEAPSESGTTPTPPSEGQSPAEANPPRTTESSPPETAAVPTGEAVRPPEPAPVQPPAGAKRPMSDANRRDMDSHIADVRRGDDPDERALAALRKLREDNDKNGIENPPQLLQFLAETAERAPSGEQGASNDSGADAGKP